MSESTNRRQSTSRRTNVEQTRQPSHGRRGEELQLEFGYPPQGQTSQAHEQLQSTRENAGAANMIVMGGTSQETFGDGNVFSNVAGDMTNNSRRQTWEDSPVLPRRHFQLFSRSQRVIDSGELYSRLLWSTDCGFPLWNPDADRNLPLEYRLKGISIGDVGILRSDGSFDFMFNVYLEANDPVNMNRVPNDFVPLILRTNIDTRLDSLFLDVIASYSIERERSSELTTEWVKDYKFSTATHVEGALVITPEGMIQECCLHPGLLQNYAAQHGESWYLFANGQLRMQATNGSIHIVTACTKAKAWCLNVFTDPNRRPPYHFEFKYTRTPCTPSDFHESYNYEWTYTGLGTPRSGAKPRLPKRETQCLFMKTYAVEINHTLWGALSGKPRKVSTKSPKERKAQVVKDVYQPWSHEIPFGVKSENKWLCGWGSSGRRRDSITMSNSDVLLLDVSFLVSLALYLIA
ncbi:hypothetical protein BDQ17DRAFT_1306127 [Cyathus striatus]|nr:hypothetical protein BDQ17DRAFT_1306127 [Cyathus striatus]